MTKNKDKRKHKVVKWIVLIFVLIVVVLLAFILILRGVNSNKYKINTEHGIQENTFVEIDGIDQYLSILGENKDNPVILFIHGGPGFPLTYLSSYFSADLVEKYTIVCYDQRGCGRTYYENNDQGELSIDILLSDIDGIVQYIKTNINDDKVIIMGQSWGTVLGTTYAKSHPENVMAYIGVGQVTDFDDGKIFAAQEGMKLAKEQGNTEDVQTLIDCISKFQETDNMENIDINNLETMILNSIKYLQGSNELPGMKQMWLGITSPDMNIKDMRWFMNAASTEKILELEMPLINYMYYKFDIDSIGYDYDVPVFYIQGSNDFITPTPMVMDYYEKVNAPVKNLYSINETGHTPFLDIPEAFAKCVDDAVELIK